LEDDVANRFEQTTLATSEQAHGHGWIDVTPTHMADRLEFSIQSLKNIKWQGT
jgi:hypothetical protein